MHKKIDKYQHHLVKGAQIHEAQTIPHQENSSHDAIQEIRFRQLFTFSSQFDEIDLMLASSPLTLCAYSYTSNTSKHQHSIRQGPGRAAQIKRQALPRTGSAQRPRQYNNIDLKQTHSQERRTRDRIQTLPGFGVLTGTLSRDAIHSIDLTVSKH